ncbi:MAG: branched-chain amino acid aminotransferase [Chitinophagales bacterium]|nr:branched-chain amino acid aminotransferase [Chitinophagales bacterium]MDW8418723.1 branched-chain amino acid aminotransferase [Chitinophagales bacterium]
MGYKIHIERTKRSRIGNVDFSNLPFGSIFSDHMFIAEYENGDWDNCRVVPFGNISIHPALSALHYGQAIFEGIKAEKNNEGVPIVFRPQKNFERFNLSAERMAMPQVPEEIFMGAIDHLLTIDRDWIPTSPDSSLYIRPFMFAAEEIVGIKPAERFIFCVFTSPVGKYYHHPVRVYVHDKYVRAFPGGTGYAKCAGNYAAAMMPLREIKKLGYDQILWLDGIHHRYLQEIGTMNIFVIIDGIIITPSLHEGTILHGVTRDSIITLAQEEGYVVQERDISIDEVIDAHNQGKLDDMFGTGTAAVLSHIGEFFYKGEVYELPPVELRDVSNKLRQRLIAIKSGKAEDLYGWLYHVPVGVYAAQIP